MAESKLDQIVKGASPPGASATAAAVEASTAQSQVSTQPSEVSSFQQPPQIRTTHISDPTSLLPSSPPQIYLNLLILEASLRSQYLTLRDRRRQNSFVLTLLFLWIAYFTYLLFFRPREDGKGVGGSVYWLVDRVEKMAWMGGIITTFLFYATGQWERGVRWPRRWVAVANRGLRGMNCKIVLMKESWWKETVSNLAFIFAYQLFFPSTGSSYHYIEHTPVSSQSHHKRQPSVSAADGIPRHIVRSNGHEYTEEDISPGGDHIKLLLLPKPFSADFREKWELYRTEFWEKENERRADLRGLVKRRQREAAKSEGGWLWWTGWRGWKRTMKSERHPFSQGHFPSHSSSHQTSLKDGTKKRRPSVIRDGGSHSRSSSRSSVFEYGDDGRPARHASTEERSRRWSTSTAGSTTERRRRKTITSSSLVPPEVSGRTTRSMRMTSAGSGIVYSGNEGSRPSTPGSEISTLSQAVGSERGDERVRSNVPA